MNEINLNTKEKQLSWDQLKEKLSEGLVLFIQ
jgi:hypothetical protein